MAARPFVLLSVAMSLDGHIDDAGPARLVLSGADDLDRVDEVRAGVDAILVGAGTVRADDPRLQVRSPRRRAERAARGLPETPARVVLTASGALPAGAQLFGDGPAPIVYTCSSRVAETRHVLGAAAVVVDAGEPVDLHAVLADLVARGVARLLVEGGTAMHTLFLASGVVDELHVAVAPFLVGDAAAPRFVSPAAFPQGPERRMRLVEARSVGDVALLRYRTT